MDENPSRLIEFEGSNSSTKRSSDCMVCPVAVTEALSSSGCVVWIVIPKADEGSWERHRCMRAPRSFPRPAVSLHQLGYSNLSDLA